MSVVAKKREKIINVSSCWYVGGGSGLMSSAYQKHVFEEFKRVLKSNLEHDTFINRCKEDMLEKMRTQAILNLLEPYTTKIEISVISTKLGVKEDEGMELLRLLILNNGVHWLVDEVEGLLGER
ncbi:unnamed protein product [Brassica oleracea var. botrytis]